jgi:hypothetical protein
MKVPPASWRRPDDHLRGPAGHHPVDRLVGERVGNGVLGPRDVGGRPEPERAEDGLRLGPQRLQLRVLDPPAAVQLLDDQLGVEEQVDPIGAQLAGEAKRPNDARPLGDVVRRPAEVFRDRGVGPGKGIERIAARAVDQGDPQGRRPGVAARRPVCSDDEAQPAAGGRRLLPERKVQDGPPAIGRFRLRLRPVIFRQTIWIGS